MCGIVGYVGERNAVPVLLQGLKMLEYRGYDSAGVAVFNQNANEIEVRKTKGRVENLESKLYDNPVAGKIGIGHTRWATHGVPSDENAHPHFSSSEKIAVVHNGIIENYVIIRDFLRGQGYEFVSETDTECVAQLADYYYRKSGNFIDSVYRVLAKVDGSYALAFICADSPDKIITVKKNCPLIVGLGEGENFIASDLPAILKYTRNTYIMEDDEIAVVEKDKVKIYNRKKEEIQKDIYVVDWTIEAAEKSGYEHFMLKEIYEQPKVVADNLNRRFKPDGSGIQLDKVKLGREELEGINQIYIVACGTAYYAGLVGKFLLEKMAKIHVNSDVASEFRYKEPLIDEKTLVIVISQSGETADTLEAMRLAKRKGSRVLAVVNVVGSTIAREADDVIYTLAGPEIAVASTKAFSAQVVAMFLLTLHISREKDKLSLEEFKEIKREMELLPSHINNILTKAPIIKRFMEKYIGSKNVFYIGRGLDYVVCQEGSLKLKEIAYLHSEPYAAGELKHGPIALIEDSTLVIGVATQQNLFSKTMSNIKEVKARGARVLVIAMEGNREIENYADDYIYIPKTHPILTPLLANIPQQLFAYYMAIGLGNDVDKPRNLAKSVTVE
ncbi:MAG: glutamine--fructose-6-phosphate transaminase (isomerizing) [Clostridiales bacterium]|nr:glutamine--fructose-6-phosphate transaminase (isomerizing) [Clostridiales bacterium]